MWYPYRYLIAGRSKWEVVWFDPSIIADPRAYFEQKIAPKLGPLVGFEPVPEMRPKTGKEFVAMVEALSEQMGL